MQKHSENQRSLYVIVWEFHVRPGLEAQFERAYGPEGDWVQFFRRDSSYVGTELIRDVQTPNRYLTVDVWLSQAACEAFRERNLEEYQKLDRSFETLTERETRLGAFHTVGDSMFLMDARSD